MSESRRMTEVQTPIIPLVGDMVRSTPGAISLGQGVVSYGPPPSAIEAAAKAAHDHSSHLYGAVLGTEALREALAAKLLRENGIRIGAENAVVVTSGANMGFLNAVLAVASPGDEVILQTPYYFNHEMAIRMAGCTPVCVETDERHQLRLGAIAVAMTPRTRAIVTVSPNNPTGALYPEADLRAVNELCRAASIYHIHDEAYEYFTYGAGRPFVPGSIPGSASHTIELFSLSKAYGFAGWRIGYMVIPEGLRAAVRKIQDTNLICPTMISQAAALAALQVGEGYSRSMNKDLPAVREIAVRAFAEIADLCTAPTPEGAFYFFVRIRSELDPLRLVERLVSEHGVAAIPGTAFGVAEGCSLRVAFGALETATAARGIDRLVTGLKAIVGG